MSTETETRAALDALYEKSNAAHAASSAAFAAWQKARERQGDVAIGIADAAIDGLPSSTYTLDRYREACRVLREADAEDDRLRAIARAARAELDTAREANQ